MSTEHETRTPAPAPVQGPQAQSATTGGSSPARQSLRGKSYAEGALMLKPDPAASAEPPALWERGPGAVVQREGDPAAAPNADAPGATAPPAPVMQGGQRNPEPTAAAPEAPAAVTGEIAVDASATDVANRALEAMRSGTTIEQNTRARIVAGTHRLAYLEDLAVDPQSETLLRGWGHDPARFTVKLNPWTGARMIIQNNAAGFATGQNIVGSRAQPVSFWRTTLLCHEVSHIIHGDGSAAANTFERYKGEFRAYWVAGFHDVSNLSRRARQIKDHILRNYPILKGRYDSDAAFKRQVDAHTAPDAGDNLTNAPAGTR